MNGARHTDGTRQSGALVRAPIRRASALLSMRAYARASYLTAGCGTPPRHRQEYLRATGGLGYPENLQLIAELAAT